VAEVPLFDREIQGIESLRLIADKIMGEGQLEIHGRKSMKKEYDRDWGLFHVRLFYLAPWRFL
jgi:hypothetical protein